MDTGNKSNTIVLIAIVIIIAVVGWYVTTREKGTETRRPGVQLNTGTSTSTNGTTYNNSEL